MDRKDFLEQIHDETPAIIKDLNDQNEMILTAMHNLENYCIQFDKLRYVYDYDTVPDMAQETLKAQHEIEFCLQNIQSIDVPKRVLEKNETCRRLSEENTNLLIVLDKMYKKIMEIDNTNYAGEVGIGVMSDIQKQASSVIEHAINQRHHAEQQTSRIITGSDGFDRDGDSGNRNKPQTDKQTDERTSAFKNRRNWRR